MAGDSTAVAIYKLSMDSQQYVAQAQAAMQANQQLAASAAPVAAGEEKIDKALRGGEAALDRKIARFDAATRINNKYAKEYADLVKIEEAGIGSAEKRAKALEVTTAAHEKELEALDRVKKANAENAAALGGQNAALQVAAAAGDRYAQALLTMDAKQQQLNKDLQAGKIGLAEHARLINLTQEAYRSSTTSMAAQDAAMRKSSTATGLARYELINLSRQFQDIGVSLAGGQSPLRIIIEQGSQIADVFASSKAAFADLWQSMVSGIARFGGSAAGLAVGLMAIGAAGAAAALHWQEGQRVIEQALAGIGRRSGATVADINKIAESVSETTRLSSAQAREIASGFAGTGEMFSGSIKAATELTDKFALAMGKSAVEGGKELAAILKNVESGAGQLDKIFGILDDQTQQYIVSLVRQNREEEARLLLIAKAGPIIKEVADAASFWARAWMSVSGAASQAADSIGKAIDKGLEFAKIPLQYTRAPQFGAAAKQVAGAVQGVFADKGTLAKDLGLDDLNKMTTATEQAAAAQKAYNSRLDEYSKQAGEAVRSTIPQIEAIQKLEGALADLERAQADPNIKVAQRDQLQPAIDATKLQIQLQKESQAETARHVTAVTELAAKYKDVSIAVAMTLDSLKDQTAVAEAIPGPAKAAAEDQARFNQLRLEGKTIAEATNVTDAERVLIQARARAQIEAQNHALKQGSELAQASIEGRGDQVKAEQEYVNQIRAGATARDAQIAKEGLAAASAAKRRVEEELATREYKVQLQAIEARSRSERLAVAGVQAYYQALAQGKQEWQAQAAAARAMSLEEAKLAQVHRDNMAALNDQLMVAKALPGAAQQMAQMEADINARLREGATLMEAEAEAATKRQIAIEQANRAVDQQIIGLRQAVEMERARMEGTEGAVAAAQAYANAIRSGASETKAAALAAATLEANLERAQIAAENMANQMGRAGSAAGAMGGALGARLDQIGSGLGGAAGWLSPMGPGANLLLTPFRPDRPFGQAPAPPPPPPLTPSSPALTIEFARQAAELAKAMGAPEPEAWTNYQNMLKQAADSQQQAAESLQSAAQSQIEAAKAAREAQISAFDEAVKDIIATKLLAGQSAQAVNMLIEGGAIQFGTASTRFQTQLDLYKRAGASNAQIAADIRAGVIGEGARPSELLDALDSLKDAVTANTEAQIGLSDFYTQQGDRLLGYRGFNVQRGGFGATTGTGTTTGDTGTIGGGGMTGGMGGVVNQPGVFGDPIFETAPQISYRNVAGGYTEKGYYQNGQWVRISYVHYDWIQRAWIDTGSTPSLTVGNYLSGMIPGPGGTYQFSEGGIMSPAGPMPLRSYADGGVARGPQMAMFGEGSQPEAFVPLKGGAIPVKLIGNNDNKPTTVVNINAPLVNFTAEPTRDEVRESAFQASQMLRRVASGG